ncbi:MAG TPA: response regulator transcription factor [Gemmatimonadales bacterium]|nr:response regulator transcription factor [Gemmatimonadales bacterium]
MTRPNFRPVIWLVEDNVLYRQTLADLVERSGRFRGVRAFADGEAALEALRDGRELPRLILMDLALPGRSGTECIREIRKRHPAIPVVMLTVHQSNEKIFEAVCAGASGYLLKSASREEILQGITNVLEGGGAMDAQIARRVLEMFARMATPQADYGLSEREREILHLLVESHTKHRIAEHLGLSPHTIDGHMRNIYMKLHVNTRSGAVAKALREHLL